MANVSQIYEILNSASKQAFGESAVVVTDTSTFIALGSAVVRSDVDTENYLNTLVDRILLFELRFGEIANKTLM